MDAPFGPPERLRIERKTIYKQFNAESLAAIQRELDATPDFISHGLTLARFELVQQLYPQGSGCRLVNYQLQLHLQIQLPQWLAPANVEAVQIEQWLEALAALTEHEEVHADQAERTARRLDQALQQELGQADESGCANVLQRTERLLGRALMRYRLQSSLFDQFSDFGRSARPSQRTKARP